MEHVPGRVFKDVSLPELTREQRGVVFRRMCEVLATIHQVDLKAAGLEDYGKHGGC